MSECSVKRPLDLFIKIKWGVIYSRAGSTELAGLGAQHGIIDEGNTPKAFSIPMQASPETTHTRMRRLVCLLVGLLDMLLRGD